MDCTHIGTEYAVLPKLIMEGQIYSTVYLNRSKGPDLDVATAADENLYPHRLTCISLRRVLSLGL
jgi:hypothetical protein